MIMITVLTQVGTVISFSFMRVFWYNKNKIKKQIKSKEVCLCR